MKADICNESPLLLIDKKKGDWKTLPESSDEPFSEMFTIGGDELLKTYYACLAPEEIHPSFLQHFDEIRTKRNKIIHGLGEAELTPEYVLKLVLNSFTYLLGKDEFWDAVLDKFYRHPGFEYDDPDVEWVNRDVNYENEILPSTSDIFVQHWFCKG